jgi:hypothetical protein
MKGLLILSQQVVIGLGSNEQKNLVFNGFRWLHNKMSV